MDSTYSSVRVSVPRMIHNVLNGWKFFNFFLLTDPDPAPGGKQNHCGIHVDPYPRQLYNCSVSGMRGELLPGGVEEAQQVHLHAHVSYGKKVDAMLSFSEFHSFQS